MASSTRRPVRPLPIFHQRNDASKAANISLGNDLLSAASRYKRNQVDYDDLEIGMTRLLILKRRQPEDDDIYVDMIQVPFADLGKKPHRFEALSYHWGEGEAEKPIFFGTELNHHRKAHAPLKKVPEVVDAVTKLLRIKQVFVKPNLYQALRHLRKSDEDIKIWVDAICINQDKQDEKEEQVKRLPEIYSKATRVLIWLGRGNSGTSNAMNFIRELLGDLVRVDTLLKDQSKVHSWRDLMSLIRDSSWFSRRWVIQELALAQEATVHCGDDALHWMDLRDAISIFSDNFDAIRSLLKRSPEFDNDYNAIGDVHSLPAKVLIETTNNVFRTRQSKQSYEKEPLQKLEYLVSTLSAYDTADPRDTINAFRSIAKETSGKVGGGRPPPPHSYTKDLLQVYMEFVEWVIETSESIDILCRRWAMPERTKSVVRYPDLVKLPSWIQTIEKINLIDDAFGSRRHGDSFVGMPGYSSYNASYTLKPRVSFGKSAMASGTGDIGNDDVSRPIPPPSAIDVAFRSLPTIDSDRVHVLDQERALSRRAALNLPKIATVDLSGGHLEPQLSPNKGSPNQRKYDGSDRFDINGPPSRERVTAKHTRPEPLLAISPTTARSRRFSNTSDQASLTSPASQASFDDFASPKCTASERDASIYIEGLLIGTLAWVTNPTTDGVVPAAALNKILPKSKEHDHMQDKVWRTLSAERDNDGGQPPVTFHRACQYVLEKLTPNKHINTKELLSNNQPSIVKNFLKRVQAVVWDRCFLEVEPSKAMRRLGGQYRSKMHGFGPSKVKEGDILCILFGCSVPCVLRRFEDLAGAGTFYRFIGEAYVYGVMDGETVSWRTQEDIDKDKQIFRIL